MNMITTMAIPTVGEIAAQNPGAIEVFEQFGIDYCCHGKQKLEDACKRANVEQAQVEEALSNLVVHTLSTNSRVNDWSLDLLADYIIQNHHGYINKVTPEIQFLINKVLAKHGPLHPELDDIKDAFQELSEELAAHMAKEEKILFPRIRQIAQAQKTNSWSDSGFRMQGPIDVMEHEHDLASTFLTELRQLTKNYSLPEGACNSYSLLYSRLNEFEQDLHTHIHLENNILFVKAMELENSFTRELVNP